MLSWVEQEIFYNLGVKSMILFVRKICDRSRVFEDISDIVYVKLIYAQTGLTCLDLVDSRARWHHINIDFLDVSSNTFPT